MHTGQGGAETGAGAAAHQADAAVAGFADSGERKQRHNKASRKEEAKPY